MATKAAADQATESDRQINLKDAITEAISEEMERDESVYLLGEDIQDPFGGVFQVTLGLSTKFGRERVVETPIAEAAIMGMATGSAMMGLRPIAEIMLMDFLGVCMDQLYNHAAKLRYMSAGQVSVPMVVRTQAGGGGGFGAQHSQHLEAWVCHVPGLKVVQPSTPADAKGLMLAAIRDDDPVIYIENASTYWLRGSCPEGDYVVPLGKGSVRREGSDCTVVAYGPLTVHTLAAADELAAEGIEIEVIDPRSLVPLDMELILESVSKTGRAVVAHEAVRRGGYGGEIAAQIQENAWGSLKGPVRRVGAMNTPIPYTKPLETEMLPQSRDIVDAVKATLGD
jgi:pyruvate dehydrogenase E1 component beta subunit